MDGNVWNLWNCGSSARYLEYGRSSVLYTVWGRSTVRELWCSVAIIVKLEEVKAF